MISTFWELSWLVRLCYGNGLESLRYFANYSLFLWLSKTWKESFISPVRLVSICLWLCEDCCEIFRGSTSGFFRCDSMYFTFSTVDTGCTVDSACSYCIWANNLLTDMFVFVLARIHSDLQIYLLLYFSLWQYQLSALSLASFRLQNTIIVAYLIPSQSYKLSYGQKPSDGCYLPHPSAILFHSTIQLFLSHGL